MTKYGLSALRALLQAIVELVKRQNGQTWEWNLFEMIEVAILRNNVVRTGSDGTIDELIIILVNVSKQVEVEVGLAIEGLRMAGNGFNHIVRDFS